MQIFKKNTTENAQSKLTDVEDAVIFSNSSKEVVLDTASIS